MRLSKWVRKHVFLMPKTKKKSIINKKIFIGREKELDTLLYSLEKTRQKRGQQCILYGEMGYGKTFLWQCFRQVVSRKYNYKIVEVECSKETSPYTAFEPILKIISYLKSSIQENNIALEYPFDDKNKQRENPQVLFLKIAHFLKSVSLHFPLIIFIDNAQWCDQQTLEFLSSISNKMDGMEILLVISFRASQAPDFLKQASKYSHCYIRLAAFTPSFSQNYLHQKFYPHSFPYTFLQKFSQATHGIPLYWKEYAHFLLEEDAFFFKRKTWHLLYDVEELEFPPNIQRVIKERLRLAIRHKNYKFYELLQYASAFDGEFFAEWLKILVDNDIDEFLEWALEHNILTTSGEGEAKICRFSNETFKNLLYHENDNTVKIHLIILKKLIAKEMFRNCPAQIVYHSEKSQEYNLLTKFCYIAAKEEKAKLAYQNAIHFCSKSLNFIHHPEVSMPQSKILLCLANCLVKLKEFKKAKKYLGKIPEARTKDYVKALFLLVEVEKLNGKEKKAIENMKKIIENLSTSPQQKIMAINKIAQIHIKQKNWDEVFSLLKLGLELANEINDIRFKGAICYNLGKYYFKRSDWQKSLTTYKDCLEIYSQEKNLIAIAQCMNHIAYILYEQGNFNESTSYYKKTIAILEEIDTQEQKIKVYVDFAKLIWKQQQHGKSIELLKKGQQFYLTSGNFLEAARILTIIAQVYLTIGDFVRARQSLEKCIDLNYKEKDLFSQALCVEKIGIFFWYKNEWDKAATKFQKTIEAWEKLGAQEELARTLYFLGQSYWAKKETDTALNYFIQSLEISKNCEDIKQQAMILDSIAEIECFRGNWLKADQNLKESLKLRTSLGITLSKTRSHNIYGHMYLKQGLFGNAEQEYQTSYQIHAEQNHVYGKAEDILFLGMMYLEFSKYEEAYDKFKISLELYTSLQNTEMQAVVHEQIARCYRKQSDFVSAENTLKKVLHMKKDFLPWKKADTYYGLGRCYFFSGNLEASIKAFQEALSLYKSIENNYNVSKVLNNLGEVFVAQKKLLFAMEYFAASYILKEKMHDIEGLAYTNMHIGRVYMRLNRIDKATENFEKSIIHWDSLGHHEYVAELSFQLGDLYEREGQIAEARSNFKRAYHFFKNINRERLSIIDQKLEELD